MRACQADLLPFTEGQQNRLGCGTVKRGKGIVWALPVVCCAREAAVLPVKGVGGLLSLKKFLPISKMDMIHVLSIQQAENFFLKVYVG